MSQAAKEEPEEEELGEDEVIPTFSKTFQPVNNQNIMYHLL